MKAISSQITDEKYELLVESLGCEKIPEGIKCMMNRVEILKLHSAELIEEFRDLVEDEYKFEHFLNYNRLNKSLEYCETKLDEVVNGRMLTGIHSNVWSKIKYVHMLAKNCGIEDNLFNFKEIVSPNVKNKTIQKLINSIKVLYNKRDKIKTEDYSSEDFIKLYKFMLDSLIKKINIIVSKQSRCKDTRGKFIYSIDEEGKDRFDRLIAIMKPENKIKIEGLMEAIKKEEEFDDECEE